MKIKFDVLMLLWIVAVALLLTGIIMASRNFTQFPKQKGWISTKVSALSETESLAESARDIDAALIALDSLPSKTPPTIAEIVNVALPNVKCEIERGHLEPTLDGWAVRRENVVFERMPANGVARFVYALSTQRPPWRVVDCSVQALTDAQGTVRAAFVVEGLERKSL
jgi:hypothetical protein